MCICVVFWSIVCAPPVISPMDTWIVCPEGCKFKIGEGKSYLIYKNECLSVCLSRIGAHTVHPIAMKLSQIVVNIPGVVLEI